MSIRSFFKTLAAEKAETVELGKFSIQNASHNAELLAEAGIASLVTPVNDTVGIQMMSGSYTYVLEVSAADADRAREILG